VRDTSGRGNDITMYGATYDASDKSIDMDGNAPASASTEYLSVDLNTNESGDIPHSSSVWFKSASGANSTWRSIFELSENPRGGGHNMALYLKGSNENKLLYSTGNDDSYTGELSGLYNTWNHVVLTYDGTNKRIYRNGVLILTDAYSAFEGLVKNPTLSFSKINHANNNEGFDGRVSNFKLYYNHTLTASEVKTLYDMGRCDEGHHVVNFSKTRVGIGLGDGEAPTAALDVMGDVSIEGRVQRAGGARGLQLKVNEYQGSIISYGDGRPLTGNFLYQDIITITVYAPGGISTIWQRRMQIARMGSLVSLAGYVVFQAAASGHTPYIVLPWATVGCNGQHRVGFIANSGTGGWSIGSEADGLRLYGPNTTGAAQYNDIRLLVDIGLIGSYA
jgi:hypothetical protein